MKVREMAWKPFVQFMLPGNGDLKRHATLLAEEKLK